MSEDERSTSNDSRATWGRLLFYGALVASLVFFWWLVIYDHGVTSAHGG